MDNLDTTKVLTGNDGQIFLTLSDNSQMLLANVTACQAQLAFNNVDQRRVGDSFVYAVPDSIRVNITMTEIVIDDEIMFTKLYDDLRNGRVPEYTFATKLSRRDGGEQRQVFRSCVPDGTIDFYSLTPGETITRPWTFRGNATPELIKHFAS